MPWKAAGMEIKMAGAVLTGKYRNVFKECGYSEDEITKRVEQTFETIFYGKEEERFYHEVGDDMAYMEDTGNHDVRTEGMSYGMMVCVQMNKKEEFDRLCLKAGHEANIESPEELATVLQGFYDNVE